MSKTPKYVKSAVDNYRKKFDVSQIRLDKGTNKRIEDLGLQKSQFINDIVTSELDKLESGKKSVIKTNKSTPKEVNGKPVYMFWEEDEYIKNGGKWWHDVVFFHDDMELNDLFIKFLDKAAKENNGHKDGCRIWFDLVNLQREVSKISDFELSKMTDEEIDNIPDDLLEETIDQTAELKEHLREHVYNGNEKALFEFIGFYDLAKAE